MNRRKSPRRCIREFEIQNVKIYDACIQQSRVNQKGKFPMRNWPDPQKPISTVKERREVSKDGEKL